MKFLLIILLGLATVCLAQLPFQVKPRPRGFPRKRSSSKDDANRGGPVGGRGALDYMYRLNDTFRPSHYDVEVRVILDEEDMVGPALTAPGKVKVVGVLREPTSKIVMHAHELQINDSSITVANTALPQEYITVANVTRDPLRHFLIIELASEINPGEEYAIYMEYIAKIIEPEEGLFYRTYKAENGEERRVAATQLESVEARRMFPCFDEPDLKATFELTVIRQNNYFALSNTELFSSTPDPEYAGWTIDKFQRTVQMSTYNLALAVTDYGYTEALFGNKTARTYAPKFIIEAGAGNYSAKIAALCLSFYESFFNESYKLSKMDSIVIPGFGGAMENIGLNVYGFEYLLHFPEEDSEAHRNLLTMIVGITVTRIPLMNWHTNVKFGNLVTMKWWSELYLTEGLSTYAQNLGMEASSSDFMGIEFAILDSVQYSMSYDAGPFTHPLSWNVSTPEEIDGMFSTISYEKGASIFRMLEGFLTKETFTKGLQYYLKRFGFKGAEQEDLFQCLQEAALQDKRLGSDREGLSISKIMHSWVDQSGFPLVKVDMVGKDRISLSQKQFRGQLTLSETDGLWYIPVTVVTEERPSRQNNIPEVWLENDGEEKVIAHNTSQWIMINHNATGFYRVLYNASILQLIQGQLDANANVISPLSRSQLLDDYFVFAEEDHVNVQTTMSLTRYLHQETHFAPWSTFFEHFSPIYKKFTSHPAYPLLQRYLQPRVDSALVAIGLEESPWHTGALAILRADLLDWSCSIQSPLCREYARKLYAQWRASPDTYPTTSIDAKGTLECAMVATGGKPAYHFFFDRYQSARNDSDLREEILGSIACAMEPTIIQGFLQTTVNATSGIEPSDAIFILEKIASNPIGRPIILEFMGTNIDYMIEEIGKGSPGAVGVVLNRISTYYSTKEQLEQVQRFLDANPEKLSSLKESTNSALSQIKENIRWMESTGDEIWKWLWYQRKS